MTLAISSVRCCARSLVERSVSSESAREAWARIVDEIDVERRHVAILLARLGSGIAEMRERIVLGEPIGRIVTEMDVASWREELYEHFDRIKSLWDRGREIALEIIATEQESA